MLTNSDMNDLVDFIDHPVCATDLTRDTFDIPPFCLAEPLFSTIARCVGVRIWVSRRQETNMKGETETHRFLSVFGLRQDVETVNWLVQLIDLTVETKTAIYVNKYIFSISPKKVLIFQNSTLQMIRAQLNQIVDYNRDQKNAIIDPAFARLNIKLTAGKRHCYVVANTNCSTLAGSVSIT